MREIRCNQAIVNPKWIEREELQDICSAAGWQLLGRVDHPVHCYNEQWFLVQAYQYGTPDGLVRSLLSCFPDETIIAYAKLYRPDAIQVKADRDSAFESDMQDLSFAHSIRSWSSVLDVKQSLVQAYHPYSMACDGWYYLSMHPYASPTQRDAVRQFYQGHGCKLEDLGNSIYRVLPYYVQTGDIDKQSKIKLAASDEAVVRNYTKASIKLYDSKPDAHPLTERELVQKHMAEMVEKAAEADEWSARIESREKGRLLFHAAKMDRVRKSEEGRPIWHEYLFEFGRDDIFPRVVTNSGGEKLHEVLCALVEEVKEKGYMGMLEAHGLL